MEMDDLLSELMPIYIGELHEHVKLLVQELLELEHESKAAARFVLFESIFRTMHSLKGASRSVGLTTMASVCHEMETMLTAGQDGATLSKSDFQLLFQTFDAAEAVAELLKAGDKNAEKMLTPLLFALKESSTQFEQSTASLALRPEANEHRQVGRSPSQRPLSRVADGSVRLPVAKLDSLLAEGSELITVVNRNVACLDSMSQLHNKILKWQRQAQREKTHTGEELGRLSSLGKELEQIKFSLLSENRHLTAAVSRVTDGINGLAMVPISQACQGIERMVRDLTTESNKQIQLKFRGMELEVDRRVLEQLKDPLMHLVRNACDHGIETSEERSQSGKSERATLTIEATVIGSHAQIVVADDGRGISFDAVRARAQKLSLPTPENQTEMKTLLFSKGFSTAPMITEVSGRGIGLDVVKDKIESLHGSVDLETEDLGGSAFTITVPLTLTSLRVLFVRAGGQLFAIATPSIQTLLRIAPGDCQSMDGRTVLSMGDSPLPVVALSKILDLPPQYRAGAKIPAVVLSYGDQMAIITVEELVSEQEILVKNLSDRIKRVKHIAGSTIMPDGQIALIINTAEVLRSALTQPYQVLEPSTQGALSGQKAQRHRLLLADDSITTRSLEKHLLESAGFDVTTSVDGSQAWQIMQERPFDLVVSDVEMPKMDGFALTAKIKSSPKHSHIPVILVTALATERDKARGLSSGADAYLVKSEVEHSSLLEVIRQLI